MRKLITLLTVLALVGGFRSSHASDLTVQSVTINAGAQSITLDVNWSSTTPLDYLTTEFIITALGAAPTGQVTFATNAGEPPTPPLSATNYVFNGNSSDLIDTPLINPASVYQTNWANDTYNFADSTSVAGDYAQSGSRLWTILNLNISALAVGSYQITLGSSEYTNAANPSPTGLVPTMTGGLITVTAVPEPSTYAFGAIVTALVGVMASRQKMRAGSRFAKNTGVSN